MNYIIIHTGDIPDYIPYTFNSILSVDNNAKVFFCTDSNKSYKNIEKIHINDIKSNETKEIESLEFYRQTPWNKDPLWSSSLLRIFYLSDVINNLDLQNAVHFDSDVIIYKSFDNVENLLNHNLVNITPLNEEELVFGYSYIGNKSIFKNLIKQFKETVIREYGNMINEMKLLNYVYKASPEIFNLLRILPTNSKDFIFDPASYGQYLGGTHTNPYRFYKKRWAGEHHYVGSKILNNEFKVKFKDYPFVIKNNKKIELVNLHIHSKNLNKFLPVDYKNYLI